MKYFVRVGEREEQSGDDYQIVIDGETVTIDGESRRGQLEVLDGSPLQLVMIDSEVHRVLARRGQQKGQYDLSIEGYRFAVEALDERARAIRAIAGTSGRAQAPKNLAAPMPGLIVRVNVKDGDQVRAGQGLVVMEAMKMENELRASASGVVRRVLVSAGNAVEKGAVLLELE